MTTPKLTLADIIADTKKHDDLVDVVKRRFAKSYEYMKPKHDLWLRLYKLYYGKVDEVDDPDEPQTAVPYAFGLVEDLVAALTDILLRTKPRMRGKSAAEDEAAANAKAKADAYYAGPEYQLDFVSSEREKVITGSAWEKDTWANDWIAGRRRVRRDQQGEEPGLAGFAKKVIQMAVKFTFKAWEVAEKLYPRRVGYHCKFPSVFDVFPEPGFTRGQDAHYVMEQFSEVAIADLKQAVYLDPETGDKRPLYDFSLLEAEKGKQAAGAIQPIEDPFGVNGEAAREAKRLAGGQDGTDRSAQSDDIDRVHILEVWEPTRLIVVAQGKFIVRYEEHPLPVARTPYRLKVYTQKKDDPFGIGALEPAESSFYELNDTHKLSMRNFVRIVNQMLAVNMDAVMYPSDLKPRPGGTIRMRAGFNVQNQIQPIQQQSLGQEMLLQESNTKGIIERATGAPDLSPGVQGTKQDHETLGGLMQIQGMAAKRTGINLRQGMAYFQDQMWMMDQMDNHFMTEPVAVPVAGPDGTTSMRELSAEDLYTEDGFHYWSEFDPAYGDDNAARNQWMVLLDLSLKYTKTRQAVGDPSQPQVAIGEVFKQVLHRFGCIDTSKLLVNPDGTMDPKTELQMMLDGQPVKPNPKENLLGHVMEHAQDLAKLEQAVAEGKAPPETVLAMRAHIQATVMMAEQIMGNPLAAGQAMAGQAMQRRAQARIPEPGQVESEPQGAAA